MDQKLKKELINRAENLKLTAVNDSCFYYNFCEYMKHGLTSTTIRRIRGALYGAIIGPHPEETVGAAPPYMREVLNLTLFLVLETYLVGNPDALEQFGFVPFKSSHKLWKKLHEITLRPTFCFLEDLDLFFKEENINISSTKGDLSTLQNLHTQQVEKMIDDQMQELQNQLEKAYQHFNNVTDKLGEINMSNIDTTKAVLNKTYIFGKDADQVTVDDVFAHISRLEAEAAKYDGIKNKPKAIKAKVEEINAQIAELVKFSDEKFK